MSFYHALHALVIGVSRYQDPQHDLSYARHDAEGVADALKNEFGFGTVWTLFDEQATKAAIEKFFEAKLLQTAEDDGILIFFAGHGITVPSVIGDDRGFLVPHDGLPSPDTWASNISLTQIREDYLPMIPAKHVFLVVDACYGGLALRDIAQVPAVQNADEAVLTELTRRDRKVRQVMAAGTKDQKVLDGGLFGHSIFTGRFLEALREANPYTTADLVGVRVKDRVARDAVDRHHRQTPQFGYLMGGEGMFVFERTAKVAHRRLPPLPPAVVERPKPVAADRSVGHCEKVLDLGMPPVGAWIVGTALMAMSRNGVLKTFRIPAARRPGGANEGPVWEKAGILPSALQWLPPAYVRGDWVYLVHDSSVTGVNAQTGEVSAVKPGFGGAVLSHVQTTDRFCASVRGQREFRTWDWSRAKVEKIPSPESTTGACLASLGTQLAVHGGTAQGGLWIMPRREMEEAPLFLAAGNVQAMGASPDRPDIFLLIRRDGNYARIGLWAPWRQGNPLITEDTLPFEAIEHIHSLHHGFVVVTQSGSVFHRPLVPEGELRRVVKGAVPLLGPSACVGETLVLVNRMDHTRCEAIGWRVPANDGPAEKVWRAELPPVEIAPTVAGSNVYFADKYGGVYRLRGE